MQKSEQINELAAALSKAQGQIKGALKTEENPFFKMSYADLQSVWEAIREPLASNGLSVTQLTTETEKGTVLESVLMHSSGQWIAGTLQMKPLKDEPQSRGSAMSYARRYALSALVGVYQADDDANAASEKPKTKENPQGTGAAKGNPPTKPPAQGAEFKPGEKTIKSGVLAGKTFDEALQLQQGKGLLKWANQQIKEGRKLSQEFVEFSVYAESKGIEV